MIEVDKEELENLEKQAKNYDELVIKCQELEKEIQDLQIKNNITEEEIRNIDEQVEKEMKHEKARIDTTYHSEKLNICYFIDHCTCTIRLNMILDNTTQENSQNF